jgi:hypothetical protein
VKILICSRIFEKKCPYKKLGFCSQLLKNTKKHVSLLILVLKVSLWVVEPENKILEDVFDEIVKFPEKMF